MIMLTLVYIALNDTAPSYISQLLTEHSSSIRLRGRRKPTEYGLHSFCYYASKLWNSLPDSIHASTSLAAFKAALETLDLDKE